jgi:dihydroneopterin triphosphate diphosphatase
MTDPTMIQVHVARRRGDMTEYLVLKRSDDEDIYPGIWQVVTGMIEPDESAQQAAHRELHEEAGLRPSEFYCLPYIASFFSIRRNEVQHVPVFAAIVSEDAEVTLSEEHSEFRWVSFDEAIKILPFPSHKDGTKVMKDYVVENTQREIFRVR